MSQQKLNDAQEKYKAVFKMLDKSGDGVLTIQELKKGLTEMGNDVSDDDCVEMFMGIDSDSDKQCTCDEFVREMCKAPRKEAFQEKFNEADADGSGILDRAEVTRLVKEVKATGVTDEYLDEVFAGADKNNDGKIDYNEFMALC